MIYLFHDVDCIEINTLCDMIHANSRDKMNCNLPLHLTENLSSVFENIKYAMLGHLFSIIKLFSTIYKSAPYRFWSFMLLDVPSGARNNML